MKIPMELLSKVARGNDIPRNNNHIMHYINNPNVHEEKFDINNHDIQENKVTESAIEFNQIEGPQDKVLSDVERTAQIIESSPSNEEKQKFSDNQEPVKNNTIKEVNHHDSAVIFEKENINNYGIQVNKAIESAIEFNQIEVPQDKVLSDVKRTAQIIENSPSNKEKQKFSDNQKPAKNNAVKEVNHHDSTVIFEQGINLTKTLHKNKESVSNTVLYGKNIFKTNEEKQKFSDNQEPVKNNAVKEINHHDSAVIFEPEINFKKTLLKNKESISGTIAYGNDKNLNEPGAGFDGNNNQRKLHNANSFKEKTSLIEKIQSHNVVGDDVVKNFSSNAARDFSPEEMSSHEQKKNPTANKLKTENIKNNTIRAKFHINNVLPSQKINTPAVNNNQHNTVKIGQININIKSREKIKEEWPETPSYTDHIITEDWRWSCLFNKQGQ
ncbi:hypothetical protein HY745_03645 [Candidatus Desantisbacteria bacterium]|nr:hypothetical protein [Candidatus Desantisbacteria bacterium]